MSRHTDSGVKGEGAFWNEGCKDHNNRNDSELHTGNIFDSGVNVDVLVRMTYNM